MFPKIGVPHHGWFIMENPLKWMIWGYHYFRKHPYANYHQHGHMMSHGTWQGCLSCAIHLVTRSKKLWTLKMNRFFFDCWGIPRLCLTPFCSVNQLPKQDWSTYHTALQLVRAVWLIFLFSYKGGIHVPIMKGCPFIEWIADLSSSVCAAQTADRFMLRSGWQKVLPKTSWL